ncbi:MAG TPA: transglutaminase-like domain-containing protein [Candidatus Sulfotelmatobacter sp.]|nr:transglutaminase-like domain-containing protein [Candidatus Sulfotelmatobacter sp.]HWI56260.1 transglutaminase-like domain-containing protein [Bacillota bacterium]
MSSVGTIAITEEISESRKTALLNLLTDEDPAIFETVREQILAFGPQATHWLRPHLLSNDPTLRRRARQIVQHFERQAADNLFLSFCLNHGEEFDLEQAVWLLAQTQYPEINLDGYHALLDTFAEELRERLEGVASVTNILATLNGYLFEELEFAGNVEDYYDPENSYLNRVIDRRTGNPINMCLVYLLLGRRLQLPIAGIGLPGHFICRYQSSAGSVYVDPFNRGQLLSKAECVHYLLQGSYSVRDDYLAPVSSRRVLLRICGNLHQIYRHLEQADQAKRLQHYLIALAR